MAPLPPAAARSLARIECKLQQLVEDAGPALEEGGGRADEWRLPAAGAAAAARRAAAQPAATVTDAPPAAQPTAPACQPAPSFAHQLELAQLRRERDEAVKAQHAALRRERDAAAAEAAELRGRLDELQRAHAALERQHPEHVRRTEQASAAAAADGSAQAAALERLHAAHAALLADGHSKALRIAALETQQAVLLESYRALESERHGGAAPCVSSGGGGSTLRSPACLAGPRRLQLGPAADPPCSTERGLVPAWGGGAAPAGGSFEGDAVERLAISHSHLGLAVRCAELQFAAGRAEQRAEAAEAAAAAAEEQAAGLRVLLARAAGGAASGLQQRLETACRQLEEARALGAQLRSQLAQASGVAGCLYAWWPLPSRNTGSASRPVAQLLPPPLRCSAVLAAEGGGSGRAGSREAAAAGGPAADAAGQGHHGCAGRQPASSGGGRSLMGRCGAALRVTWEAGGRSWFRCLMGCLWRPPVLVGCFPFCHSVFTNRQANGH